MKLSKNFSLSEFESKDGQPMPPEIFKNVALLARNLQILRDFIGQPIKINSGYRSPAHNKKVGGVKGSQHTKGKAADIVVKGHKPELVAEIVIELIKNGRMTQGGVGVYNSFLHYDIRGTAARWSQRKK
jgi:uncharacterized protein YcbK (DUF882 family)